MTTVTQTTTTVTRTTAAVPRHREGAARAWLKATGFLMLALAILGLFSYPRDVAHSFAVHLEGGQGVLHWVFAVAALALAFALRDRLLTAVAAIAIGAVFLGFGLLGLVNPAIGGWHVGAGDNLLNLLLGTILALVGLVSLNRERDYERRQRTTVTTNPDVIRTA